MHELEILVILLPRRFLLLAYGRATSCLFLCQKVVGRSEQTSCLSFSSNFLISVLVFLQVSCSSTFLCLKSSWRYLRCWVLVLIRLRVLETEMFWRVLISLGSWAPKKLKLNWLAKRMGSASFTICDERIQ